MKLFSCLLILASGSVAMAQNVGIGTTSPQSRLEVQGTGNSASSSSVNVTNSAGNSALYVNDAQQVGVRTTAPHASAALDVNSTQSGVLVPRMTATQMQAIAAPATGLLVYNSDDNKFYYFNGTAWVSMVASSGGGGGSGDPTLIYTVDGF
jgi:hypothetical protein